MPLDKSKVPLLCILEPFLAGNHIIVTPVVVLITDQSLRPILNASEVQSIFSHPLFSFLTSSPLREPEPRPKDVPMATIDDELEDGQQSLDSPATTSTLTSSPPAVYSPLPTPYALGSSPATGKPSLRSRPASSTYALKPREPSYHTYRDTVWHGNPVRMHNFLTGRESEGVKPVSGMTSAILIRTAQIGYAREPEFELYAPGQPSLEERIATAMRVEESLKKACQEEGIEGDWVVKDARGRGKKEGKKVIGQRQRQDKIRARL